MEGKELPGYAHRTEVTNSNEKMALGLLVWSDEDGLLIKDHPFTNLPPHYSYSNYSIKAGTIEGNYIRSHNIL